MENKKIKILLFISSKTTPRIYLVLLKRFLQRKMPEAIINYFISSHDANNLTEKKSVYTESEKLKKDVDIFIGLDGNLPKNLLKSVKGEKYLIYLPEVGKISDIDAYMEGYDCLVTFEDEHLSYLERRCKKKGIKLLAGKEDPFKQELRNVEERENSKNELIIKHPQIKDKRILAITTRGECKRKYIERYKNINLRKILKNLPEDVVLMTNCPQLELAGESLPQNYTEKFIIFGQREMLDVLLVADWNYTNIGIAEKGTAKIRKIVYSNNGFEKEQKETCIKLWKQEESMLSEFEIQ